jgi:hypothetical protein
MKPSTIATVGGAVTIALLGAPMIAQAATQTETWTDWATASSYAGDDPTAWTGITIGDKTIIYVGAGSGVTVQGGTQNPTDQTFSANWVGTNADYNVTFEDFPPDRVHQVTMETVSGAAISLGPLAGQTTAIQYIINIDDSSFPAGPNEWTFAFGALSLDANNPGGGPVGATFQMQKRVQGLTPTNAIAGGEQWTLNSNFDIGEIFDQTTDPADAINTSADTVFCGTCTTWLVTDFLTVFNDQTASDNILNSFTNSFTQQQVPAPGALVLIATGLFGIGVSRRRARKV